MAGIVVAAGGLAAGFAAAGAGLGAFGIVARTVFTEASTAATAYAKAQQQYAAASTSKQRVAALQAEKAALAGLSPPVKTLTASSATPRPCGNRRRKPDAAHRCRRGHVPGHRHPDRSFRDPRQFLPPVEAALSG
jgi:hypothetical protein